jgi:hypothetical protein
VADGWLFFAGKHWSLAPVLGVLLVSASCLQTACGSTNESPYQVIIARNPFRLRPPPAPEAQDIPIPPAVDLKLTGVAFLPPDKRAFFRILECNQTIPKYLSLAEGEKAEGLEVLAINVETARVKIRLNGEIQLVSFETHGVKDPVVKPVLPPENKTVNPATAH